MTAITDVDLTSPAFRADPYPTYARLRAEAPVCRVKLPDKQTAWFVTRYDDAVTVLKDPRFGNDREKVMTPEQAARLPWMPSVRQTTVAHDAQPGRARPYAAACPGTQGIHARAGREHARAHPDADGRAARRRRGQGAYGPDPRLRAAPADDDHRRDVGRAGPRPAQVPSVVECPRVGLGVDLGNADDGCPRCGRSCVISASWSRSGRRTLETTSISALVQAREAGDRLSEDELLAMIFLLLVAGHETTLNLIGNGVLALLEHPAELDRLREDPDLIKPAVEELLRYDSPVQMASERYAREEVTIAGVTIAPGEMVHAMLGSANRDERQFERPDDLDITREPNRHLAFGQGVHYCVGAPLARLEGQIAINTLLRRFPDIKLAVPPQALRRRRGLGLRGLVSLPVSLSRRASLDLKPVSLHPGSKVRSCSVRPAAEVSRCPLGACS